MGEFDDLIDDENSINFDDEPNEAVVDDTDNAEIVAEETEVDENGDERQNEAMIEETEEETEEDAE